MANIKRIATLQNIDKTEDIYPITAAAAVYTNDSQTVENKLNDINSRTAGDSIHPIYLQNGIPHIIDRRVEGHITTDFATSHSWQDILQKINRQPAIGLVADNDSNKEYKWSAQKWTPTLTWQISDTVSSISTGYSEPIIRITGGSIYDGGNTKGDTPGWNIKMLGANDATYDFRNMITFGGTGNEKPSSLATNALFFEI